MRAAGAILPVRRPALAPLADRLGRDAIALSQDPGWLPRSRNLGTDRRGGAGLWGDRGRQDLLAREGLAHGSKRQAYASIAQRTRSQERSATKQLRGRQEISESRRWPPPTSPVPTFTESGTTRSDQATIQIQRLIPDNLKGPGVARP